MIELEEQWGDWLMSQKVREPRPALMGPGVGASGCSVRTRGLGWKPAAAVFALTAWGGSQRLQCLRSRHSCSLVNALQPATRSSTLEAKGAAMDHQGHTGVLAMLWHSGLMQALQRLVRPSAVNVKGAAVAHSILACDTAASCVRAPHPL